MSFGAVERGNTGETGATHGGVSADVSGVIK